MWAPRYLLPVVLVAVLAGCTSAPIPEPSPTAPVASSPISPAAPTPDATDEATVVTALVIRATTLTSYARGSVPITSWHYRDTSTADVVAALTSLLGEPETTPNGDSGGAKYDWGGFRLESLDAPDAPPATVSPLIHRWRVVVDAPTVGSISIESVDGITVGRTFDSIQASVREGNTARSGISPDYPQRAETVDSALMEPVAADDPGVYPPEWRVEVVAIGDDLSRLQSMSAPNWYVGDL